MRKEQAEEVASEGFDFRVTHRDEKTGLISHTNPYSMHIFGGGENTRISVMERPKGSGNCWDMQGNAAGRVVVKDKRITHDPEAKHIAWEAPLTADQKLARDVAATKAENIALKAELAAHEAERAKKSAPAPIQNKSKES